MQIVQFPPGGLVPGRAGISGALQGGLAETSNLPLPGESAVGAAGAAAAGVCSTTNKDKSSKTIGIMRRNLMRTPFSSESDL